LNRDANLTLEGGWSVEIHGPHALIRRSAAGEIRLLTPAASAILALSDGSRSADRIVQDVLQLFEVENDSAAHESLSHLISDLISQGVLAVRDQL
jgi:hypothetical protein